MNTKIFTIILSLGLIIQLNIWENQFKDKATNFIKYKEHKVLYKESKPLISTIVDNINTKEFLSILEIFRLRKNYEEYKHKNIYRKVGDRKNIDPILLYAIAYAETGFLQKYSSRRKTVVSSANAIGVMQLKIVAAKDACKNLNLRDYYENVLCGAYYLKHIKKYYCKNNNLFCIVMSYRHGVTAFQKKTIKKYDLHYWKKVNKVLKIKHI